jgi:hypothetical protein
VKTVMKALAAIVAVLLALTMMAALAVVTVYQTRLVDVPVVERSASSSGSYPIVDTGQTTFWNAQGEQTAAPAQGAPFYGQDAQFPGNTPSYTDNGDGTVTDNVTGLMWTQTADLNGDGTINADDQMTLAQAGESVPSVSTGGHTDWRLPTIKEQYSLINFMGVDPRLDDTDTSAMTPFIDTTYFGFGYGDTSAGERNIDAQMATSTIDVSPTWLVLQTMFGTNFADGRIKGYPPSISVDMWSEHKFYVLYVRGNPAYGVNNFTDNGDGTITDAATSLQWTKADSEQGMDWEHALAWAQQKNAENYLGHSDWRLPDVKELQSIVDYSRSPSATDSAAIDPLFTSTAIVNEGGHDDFGAYWSSTTHLSAGGGPSGAGGQGATGRQAAYVCFGRCMGKMFGLWMDVHGAGAQRSDPKAGSASDFPDGFGPQGDAIRIDNLVRLVRTAQ